MGIDVGICWKHWNRTGFAGARPQAHMLASFALMLLAPFESVLPGNVAPKRGAFF